MDEDGPNLTLGYGENRTERIWCLGKKTKPLQNLQGCVPKLRRVISST